MYDNEGRRRLLFGGAIDRKSDVPAAGRRTSAAPAAGTSPQPEADAADDDDLSVDPRRISDMWDQHGSR